MRMLNVQYRMHPEICKYPNHAFYLNLLKNSSTYKRKPGLEVLKPYIVFNLHVRDNCNYLNEDEISCVENLMRSILDLINKTRQFSVGIITPYNNQKDAIFERIRKLK